MIQIYHAHLYGSRTSKYDWLLNHDVLSTNWQGIKPQAPFYLLIPQNTDFLSEHEQGWKITDTISVNSTGVKTHRDHFYLYPDRTEITQDRRPNFSPEFLKDITAKLGYTPTPETIFDYIYAIFHSPTYRSRYAEFLKIDFPRVPLTRNPDLFEKLASLGAELAALHLMKSPQLDTPITQFEGECEPVIDPGHPKYDNGKVTINKKGDGFVGVPAEVWGFYVGGYQVCQKWLKDRKGRTLSPEDMTHYQRIIVALQETIRLMQQIDAAIPGWPLE
jgi:hypothetical protein